MKLLLHYSLIILCAIAPTAFLYSQAVEMVSIPVGKFNMGNTGTIQGEKNEYPVHEVFIQSFKMSRYEITQAQFEEIMGYNHSYNQGANKPVERVSWFEAVKFCNKLSEAEGLKAVYHVDPFLGIQWDATANGYRMPTEAEWEFACKAGSETDYYNGNRRSHEDAPVDSLLEQIAQYHNGSEKYPNQSIDVGQKQPNAFGLYDTHGNVFEWVWDWYDETYFSYSPKDHPKGPQTGVLKVLKGGAMDTAAEFQRASYRYRLVPAYTSHNIGFRIARTL